LITNKYGGENHAFATGKSRIWVGSKADWCWFLCTAARPGCYHSVSLFKQQFYFLLELAIGVGTKGEQAPAYPLSSIAIAVLVPLPVPFAKPASALLINLATVDAILLVQVLAQRLLLLLTGCGVLPYQRTLSICFLVSQLLILHQNGFHIHLRNASSVLQRCLHNLEISSLFNLPD
jgi:hypothetical protein